jgi:hypothetical protein
LITSITKIFKFDDTESKIPRKLSVKSQSVNTKLNVDINPSISMKKIVSLDSFDITSREDEDDSLCSFLIKNELGIDIYLNAISGFKVRNAIIWHILPFYFKLF